VTEPGAASDPPAARSALGRVSRTLPAAVTASIALSSFGQYLSLVAFSWSVLRVTASALAVALLFALRAAPRVIVGLPAGVLADRLGPRRSVALGNAAAAAIIAGTAAAAAAGVLSLVVTMAAAVLLGCCDAFRLAGVQALAHDLVRHGSTENGLASMNLTTQLFAFAGSTAGGFLLGAAGLPACLAVTALGHGGAAWFAERSPRAAHPAVAAEAAGSLRDGLILIRRSARLRLLAGVVMLAEIVFFSCLAVLPSYARQAIGGGPGTLGILLGSMSLGGVLALAAMTAAAVPAARLVLLAGSLIAASALLAQSVAPGLAAAIAALVVLGGALAAIDTATQSLLQRSAPRGRRSAAGGVWVFGIGAAPAGQLCIGATAAAVGVRWALAEFALAGMLLTGALGVLTRRGGRFAL
jgi:Transmembrane secretion effector